MELSDMRMRIAFLILLVFGANAQADLNALQRQFLGDFLGLSSKDLKRSLTEIQLSDAERKPKTSQAAPIWDLTLRKSSSVLRLKTGAPPMAKVHAATHLFYNTRRPLEKDWIYEGVAQVAEYFYGLNTLGKEGTMASFLPVIHEYLRAPNQSLNSFNGSYSDYGKTFLFYLFLTESFQGSDFTRSHYHVDTVGFQGIIDATFQSYAFSLTPTAWKDERVLTTQFYWSLLNGRNTLSTSLNDQFSQLLMNYFERPENALKPEPLVSTSLPPHSFRFFSLEGNTCQSRTFNFSNFKQVEVYAIRAERSQLKHRLISTNVISFNSDENRIFVVNSGNEPVDFKIECIPTQSAE